MSLRSSIAAFAGSLAGLSYADPRTRAAYGELLMPETCEPPQARLDLRTQSSCGLLARALLRTFGCQHPILRAPYRIGAAIADVDQIARDAGAWHAPTDAYVPGVGDIVRLAGPEHVLIVEGFGDEVDDGSIMYETGGVVSSVDGGQGAHGAAIARCERTWAMRGGALYLGGRSVVGVVDCTAPGLGLHEPDAVPDTLRAT